ncbi:ATP-binding protein [Nonomuraea sp. KM88]|uniref:ATP-binding protein n=1 Tax=Nonomuraea sp. KM88 TaxID=3457427 RepID=UPI003FCC8978
MNRFESEAPRRIRREPRRHATYQPAHRHPRTPPLRACAGCDRRRRTSWLFPPIVASVPQARHSVGAQARQWGFADESTTAELLVSEVLANALAHTDEPVHVRMSDEDGALRLEVEEHGAATPLPPARLSGPDEENGRGLFLLATLSRGWGADCTRTGKVVWFEVAGEFGAEDAA